MNKDTNAFLVGLMLGISWGVMLGIVMQIHYG